MTPDERKLLSDLAQRVKNVPPQQKDPEAEQFIRQLVTERPDTAYILAQTVIMQDFALRNAEAQIQDLQRQIAEAPPPPQQSGSFLSGLFGGGRSQPQAPQPASVPRVNPWGQPDVPPPGYGGPRPGYGYGPGPQAPQQQGGGFLKSAASTALGVAGGAMLFEGISSMFSDGAHAATQPHESLTQGSQPDPRDQQADYGGDGDFGDEDYGGGDDYA